MQISLPIINHPKDGYKIDLNRLIDASKVFIKRDTINGDREFCVYIFEDENKKEQYYGIGRYYDIIHYSISKGLKSRPFTHDGDLLQNTVNKNGTCRIVCFGLTSVEAHILEAGYLANCNRVFSKYKIQIGDRCSLINKRRERKWEKLITEYLGNGNNTRIAA